jgi:uncharacterized sodium:solute symporter family permease YidK
LFYFAIIAGISWWAVKKKDKNSADDYFLAVDISAGSLSALPYLLLISAQNMLLGLPGQAQPMVSHWRIMNYMHGVCWCWAG